MDNLEYIELIKEEEKKEPFIMISDRKLLRIIAEELIKIRVRMESKEGINVDARICS